MESAKLSREGLTELIFYGCRENDVVIKDISRLEIDKIIAEYCKFCNYIKVAYVRGELDTFKRAACLMVAINRGKLSDDKHVNASVSYDAAVKMCEKPYWNVGDNFDVPKKMEEVDFKKVFEKDMNIWDTSRNMIIDSLVYAKNGGMPENYYMGLELFYQVAIQMKHSDYKFVDKNSEFFGSVSSQKSGTSNSKDQDKGNVKTFSKAKNGV